MKQDFPKICLIVFLLIPVAFPQVQLKDVLYKVMDNYAPLKSAKYAYEKAELELDNQRKKQLPGLAFDSSYKYISDVATITIPPKTVAMGVNNNYDMGISATYLLFNGFAKENVIRIAEDQKEIMRQEVLKKEKDTAFETIETWKNIENLKLQKSIIKAGQDRVNIQLNKIKSLTGQGFSLPIDVLNTQLTLANYEQKMLELDSTLQTAGDKLNNMAGSIIEVPTPDEQEYTDSMTVPTLNVQKREEIMELELNRNIVAEQQHLAQAVNYPEVVLNAGYRYGRPGLNPSTDEWMSYYTFGGAIRWNLWDWGARNSESDSREKEISSIVQKKQNFTDQISLGFDAALRDYRSMQSKYKVLNKTKFLAGEKLRLITEQYAGGFVSNSDYQNAEKDFLEAQLNYEQQIVKLLLKRIEIEYLSGKSWTEWRLE
ncbi:MAG: TolC family protein [Candidatus Margulisbacteria bacterium]|nr:TolC family protein [Candidatus Margulisiibacteriota bacterium]